jgi:pantothenate kinase
MSNHHLIADELRQRVSQLPPAQVLWIGLAGAPGSGKSTLAKQLQQQLGDCLLVIPQDGYHYYRHELDTMANPQEAHRRRGAVFTFNAERFVEEMIQAKIAGYGQFPGFDHSRGDPVEAEISLNRQHRIVLVEGSFLLLDNAPWKQLREQVFDESWFLDVPLQECKRRVVERHIQVGLSRAAAEERVASNDGLNAEQINAVSPANASRIISGV